MELEQRSAEWFAWRNRGIGSSDAGVIMGVNEYRGIRELWLEKTGQVIREQTSSEDSERGVRLEDKVVRLYCERTGFSMGPLTLEHPRFPFLRASLDGGNRELRRFIEIKCPREYNHAKTRKTHYVKPEYIAQMQHQYLTTNYQACDFLSYYEAPDTPPEEYGELIVVPIEPDLEYMTELLEREIRFWHHVETKTEPLLSDFLPWRRQVIQDDVW